MGTLIASYSIASIGGNVERLQKERFALQTRMVTLDATSPHYQLYEDRKRALEASISKAQADEDDARKRLKKP